MAARQWTEEQRKAQAEKIRQHKIWLKSTGPTSEQGKDFVSQNALKTGEHTADKVAERKRKAANKRPLFKGGMILDTYGDKRFRWDRSINYFGAFKTIKKADREKIRLKLRAEAYLSS